MIGENLKNYVVGVDIGGQTVKIGVVDRRGVILSQRIMDSDYKRGEALKFIGDLADAISDLVEDMGEIQGIGVGAPNANFYSGVIEEAVNLEWTRGGEDIVFADELSKLLGGLPVRITNDANAAAMGEMTYGVARGMKNFIMLTLGTGVGSGIVINGEVVYGHDGFAGELGHTCAERINPRDCNCGLKGCLDVYASSRGLVWTVKDLLSKSEEPSILRKKDASLVEGLSSELSAKDVYEAAKGGDGIALASFRYTGEILGRSMADFAMFSSPEAFVLFGGLANASEFMLEHIEKCMNDNLLPMWRNKIKVLISCLPESDAAILGASALAW